MVSISDPVACAIFLKKFCRGVGIGLGKNENGYVCVHDVALFLFEQLDQDVEMKPKSEKKFKRRCRASPP
jgi:hypothetical protein